MEPEVSDTVSDRTFAMSARTSSIKSSTSEFLAKERDRSEVETLSMESRLSMFEAAGTCYVDFGILLQDVVGVPGVDELGGVELLHHVRRTIGVLTTLARRAQIDRTATRHHQRQHLLQDVEDPTRVSWVLGEGADVLGTFVLGVAAVRL